MDRAIAAKISVQVECNINYKGRSIVKLLLLLSFILYELIMLIYAISLIFIIKKLSCSTVNYNGSSQ